MKFERFINLFSILFLVSIITFPRSYILLKLAMLTLFVGGHLIKIYHQKSIKIYTEILVFYVLVSVSGTVWALIGLINGGLFKGIIDNVRLYVFWSIAYVIIISFLKGVSIKIFHLSILISTILIFIMNGIGFFESIYDLNILPQSFKTELDLRFGFHDGYIQFASENIASLFFIVPYLLVFQFRKDSGNYNTPLTKMCLLFGLLVAILSGRRALWISIVLTPMLILGWAIFTRSFYLLKRNARYSIYILIFMAVVFAAFIVGVQGDSVDLGFVKHLKTAFSSEDERTIQKSFIIDGFLKYPIMGSGFGVSAGYLRSGSMPWLYELTYHQLLFNFGIVGITFLLSYFLLYLYLISKKSRHESHQPIPFCIMIGFFSFLIGSYSNPYLGSFDFLIYIAMLPYLATIKFEVVEPKIQVNAFET